MVLNGLWQPSNSQPQSLIKKLWVIILIYSNQYILRDGSKRVYRNRRPIMTTILYDLKPISAYAIFFVFWNIDSTLPMGSDFPWWTNYTYVLESLFRNNVYVRSIWVVYTITRSTWYERRIFFKYFNCLMEIIYEEDWFVCFLVLIMFL